MREPTVSGHLERARDEGRKKQNSFFLSKFTSLESFRDDKRVCGFFGSVESIQLLLQFLLNQQTEI